MNKSMDDVDELWCRGMKVIHSASAARRLQGSVASPVWDSAFAAARVRAAENVWGLVLLLLTIALHPGNGCVAGEGGRAGDGRRTQLRRGIGFCCVESTRSTTGAGWRRLCGAKEMCRREV